MNNTTRLGLALLCCTASLHADLSPIEQAAGWKELSAAAGHFKGYKQAGFPAKGWTLKDGVLLHAAQGGGGDVLTADQYGDFELAFEFKTGAKANSGIMYRVAETLDTPWMTGPEYQVIDDAGNDLKPEDAHSTGACYDLISPAGAKPMKPAGEWNQGRIYLRNGQLQHWVNGAKVVEATIFDAAGKPTDEWKRKIAGSKFKDYTGFGVLPRGHLAFQDHGDEVGYRGVRVRALDAAMPGEIALFNGKDLDGWDAVVPELAGGKGDPKSVWSVKDGILVCSGTPVGYIRTQKPYTNFILKLEWRFNPETKKAGNSGVLLRMVGEDKVWPKSVEAQLQSGSAGDFWNIGDYKMTTEAARTNGRNTRKTHGAERPVGEWNEYEILVNGDDVVLKVNGEELNRATGVEQNSGRICLQSEGAEIHFRNIRLVELK